MLNLPQLNVKTCRDAPENGGAVYTIILAILALALIVKQARMWKHYIRMATSPLYRQGERLWYTGYWNPNNLNQLAQVRKRTHRPIWRVHLDSLLLGIKPSAQKKSR